MRTVVAVVFGGVSEEHAVSVRSAEQVARELNLAKHDPRYIGITRAGAWRLVARPAEDWESAPFEPAILSPDRARRGLLVQGPHGDRLLPVDVVLPVLHGRLGEDGAVQGLCELAGVPYVGCDPRSGVLAMDKALALLVAGAAGVTVPRYRVLAAGDAADAAGLAHPVFVKPARSGSSFGVTRVERALDLAAAVETARRYDPGKVLIEQGVTGREVGCAVLESDGRLVTGEVDELRTGGGLFRIHQEQAPETNTAQVVPADVSAAAAETVRRAARTVFRALGCRGLARVDGFLKDDGEFVLGEVNTFPGLTAYSRYPRMMAAAGVPMAEVLDRLIAGARTGAAS